MNAKCPLPCLIQALSLRPSGKNESNERCVSVVHSNVSERLFHMSAKVMLCRGGRLTIPQSGLSNLSLVEISGQTPAHELK